MFKLIIKRLGLMIPLLIIISMVVFALAIIQPGDPFQDNMVRILNKKH